MAIRGITIAAGVLFGCNAIAQTPLDSPFIPSDIEQLQEALTVGTQNSGQLIEIPAALAQDWLEASDSPVWTAIQQGSPAQIDFESLLGQQSLHDQWLADGIDPFAIYGEDGNLDRIWIRPVGTDPSGFADAVNTNTRAKGWFSGILTAVVGGIERSSLTQRVLQTVQEVAAGVCGLGSKPERVSFGVGLSSFGFGTSIEITYETEVLCEWSSS